MGRFVTFSRSFLRLTFAFLASVTVFGCGDGPGPDRQSAKKNESQKSLSSSLPTKSQPNGNKVRTEKPTFQLTKVSSTVSGITFRHVSGNAKDKPFPAANGSGLGAIDYDLDGRYDLYFLTGTPFPMVVGRKAPTNRFYRNLGGWRFEEATSETGLGHNGFSSGIAVGDFDADGFPDVYITCYGENKLYKNCGDGTFLEMDSPSGQGGNFSTSATFLDYNNDGLLDLYVCNYGKWSYETNPFCGDRTRNVRIFCSPKSLEPEFDWLLQNNGDGTFRDVSKTAGFNEVTGRGQGILAMDANGDGKIDLYQGNDIHPNFLFTNDGKGRFQNRSESSGSAYDRQGQMQAGMGVAGADVNRDGRWDLFVTNFEGEHHTLYLQNSPNNFHDVSVTHGIAAASKPWVGWGVAFVDFDLDAWNDLIVTNGHVDDNLHEMGRDTPYEHPALVWQNKNGRFRFLGESVGDYFHKRHPGRGLVRADLDNDGDTDIVISHTDQPPALLRNDRFGAAAKRKSVVLRLIGRASNRDAVGSRVVITSKAGPRVEQIQGGGSYLSAHSHRLVLAIEDGQNHMDVQITWPSGRRSSVVGLQAGRRYDLIEPDAKSESTRRLEHINSSASEH